MIRKVIFYLFITFLIQACGSDGSDSKNSLYPDIGTFMTTPSDRFIVDVITVDHGHPFKGVNAKTPHSGAHVHFDNTGNSWPQTGVDIPKNYPAIYAVADGTINRVETYFPVLSNYRYGISLAFAISNGQTLYFDYGIEPMIDPGDNKFYEPYILVTPGQQVNKGDIIGYMYVPPSAGIGTHIHFHISNNNGDFIAPAIFNKAIVDDFHFRFNDFAYDDLDLIPACMGYKLAAKENPFGTGAVEYLSGGSGLF